MCSCFVRSVAMIVLWLMLAGSAAAVPPTINYQGRLTDSFNKPVTDATYTLNFSIYSVSAGGSPLWSETQDVTTSQGLFTAVLGSVTPLSAGIFDGSTRFLAMALSGQPESNPRLPMVSVPYAMVAGTVSGTTTNCHDCDTVFLNQTGPETLTATSRTGFTVLNTGTVAREAFISALEGESTDTISSIVSSCMNAGSGTSNGGSFMGYAGGGGPVNGLYSLAYNPGSSQRAMGVYGSAKNYGTGSSYGGYFEAGNYGSGYHYGLYAKATGSSNWTWGVYSNVTGEGSGSVRGIYSYVNGNASGDARGAYFQCIANGTGEAWGMATAAIGSTNSPTIYGVYAEAGGASMFSGTAYGGYFHTTAPSSGGTQYGIYSLSESHGTSSSFGVYGRSEHHGSGSSYGGYFLVDSNGTGNSYGVRSVGLSKGSANTYGIASVAANRSTGIVYGGYFEALDYGTGGGYGIYAKARTTGAPASWAGYFDGHVKISSALIVLGTKSAAVPVEDGTYRQVYCQESPENWFEDFGEGRLVNGKAHIELDPVFLQTVTISATDPMKVFIQLNDPDCNGTAVIRGTTGFDVVELMKGASGASFTYRVVAKRRGYETVRLATMPGPTPEEASAQMERDRQALTADESSMEQDRRKRQESLDARATEEKRIAPERDR